MTTWVLCRGCRALIFEPRFVRDQKVCRECGRHAPLTADERIDQLLDPGTVEVLPLLAASGDPLGFVDQRPYPDRLRDARESTGLGEGVRCAAGRVEGMPVVVAVMDFRFMGGSLGAAVGEAVTQAAETALTRRTPLIVVTASGGARMQEGALALMQMAKTSQAIRDLDQAGILTIALITDPTYGGVAASFASLCDVTVAEPGARMGFAGPRVIRQTLRQELPEGFQTAEFLLDRGLIDAVQDRRRLRTLIGRTLRAAAAPAAPAEHAGPSPVLTDPAELVAADPWEVVRRARHLGRPTTRDHLAYTLGEFQELRGDRTGNDCPAIVGGLGRLDGAPVVVIGHQKGHTPAELAAANFGMASPAGYRKAARLMRLAEKLGAPVLTFVDTPGAYPGVGAEEQGQSIAIAESIALMSTLSVPVVTVITGEGGSGGALALAVANRVLICANGIYSVISPEGCAAILFDNADEAPRAAAALGLDSPALLREGIVDGVIPEPPAGADAAPREAMRLVRDAVVDELRRLRTLDPETLTKLRRRRFRRFGAAEPVAVPA